MVKIFLQSRKFACIFRKMLLDLLGLILSLNSNRNFIWTLSFIVFLDQWNLVYFEQMNCITDHQYLLEDSRLKLYNCGLADFKVAFVSLYSKFTKP